jgi:hypothetical protein
VKCGGVLPTRGIIILIIILVSMLMLLSMMIITIKIVSRFQSRD